MKSSLIYLGAALAQPLILFLIRKIGGAGMNSVQLPYFRMVHELDGRVRYFSELMKDREFCRLFDEKLNSLPGITGVRSNPLTGTSLVTRFSTSLTKICANSFNLQGSRRRLQIC